MQPDSLQINKDTVAVVVPMDTAEKQPEKIIPQAELHKPEPQIVKKQNTTKKVSTETSTIAVAENPKDSVVGAKPSEVNQVTLFFTSAKNDSSIYHFSTSTTSTSITTGVVSKHDGLAKNRQKVFEKEWVFGLSVFTALLFIVMRLFYQKHLAAIANSLLNLQLSEKLLRERNLLLRRVSFLLNISYLLALSLYFYHLAQKYAVSFNVNNQFFLYLTIFAILAGVVLLRYTVTWFVAFVFDAVPVFKEYLHNTYIINKNLGLYLFPLVAAMVFVNTNFVKILFIISTLLLIVSFIFRYVKGLQIIMKNRVFLFYSILYLCTLEILPLLVGIKFVLTQR